MEAELAKVEGNILDVHNEKDDEDVSSLAAKIDSSELELDDILKLSCFDVVNKTAFQKQTYRQLFLPKATTQSYSCSKGIECSDKINLQDDATRLLSGLPHQNQNNINSNLLLQVESKFMLETKDLLINSNATNEPSMARQWVCLFYFIVCYSILLNFFIYSF